MTRIVIWQSQDCVNFDLEFEQTDRQTDRENTFILPVYMAWRYSPRFKTTAVEESRVISVHVLFFFVHYVLCSHRPITGNMHNLEITKIHDMEMIFLRLVCLYIL